MVLRAFLRCNLWISLGLLVASCQGIKLGNNPPNDILPQDAQIIASGPFTSTYTGVTAAGTAAVYYSPSLTQFIVRLEGVNTPAESGLQIFANSTFFVAQLRFYTGNQDYFVTTNPGAWTMISIHSTQKNSDYLQAALH